MESLFVLPVDQYYHESPKRQEDEDFELTESDSERDSTDIGFCTDFLKNFSKQSCDGFESASSTDADYLDEETEIFTRYGSSSSIMGLLQDSTPKFTSNLNGDWKTGINNQKTNLKNSYLQSVQKLKTIMVTNYMVQMNTLKIKAMMSTMKNSAEAAKNKQNL